MAGAITQRRPVSPAARKHARELGIDVEKVPGTGPHGAVTVEDVEKAAASAKEAAAPAVPADRYAEMRKAIAAAMSRSKREIPHYYLSETIPMQRAAEWLAHENEKRPVTERILMGALQIKAVALALAKAPELNGFWLNGAFQPATGVHIGVAISIRQGGLIPPAIHDVDKKSLPELMRALSDLVARVRAGSLRSSEMSDPTITVTNLGETGVESVFGVIYPPQVALVGFGRMETRPWSEDGKLFTAPLVTASLSADHRASNGIRGARFLAELRERLQHPEEL
jgi:pyruvate dehydrogenase E2 component (dihydrolipoamide acetyltransferase)